MKLYSEDHQWIDLENGVATVGVSSFATGELGEVNFVEVPDVGVSVIRGGTLCVVESMKAAADVLSPVSGKVLSVNDKLTENPSLLNESPEEDGWICRLSEVDPEQLSELMTPEMYQKFLAK